MIRGYPICLLLCCTKFYYCGAVLQADNRPIPLQVRERVWLCEANTTSQLYIIITIYIIIIILYIAYNYSNSNVQCSMLHIY